jgi:exonuclease VII small subunit
MKEERFTKQYPDLEQLLAAAFASDAEFDQFDEDITLAEYFYGVSMLNNAKRTLSQAKEVLQLKPFPEDLIGTLSNIVSKVETRKEWLEKVAKKLEARIKKLEKSAK